MKRSDWLLVGVVFIAGFVALLNGEYLAGWRAGVLGQIPDRTGEYLRGYNEGVVIFNRMVEQEQAEFTP